MLILQDFESVSFMPKTQKYAKVGNGVHYPEENGSWEFL
jgi:phage pi2 protein 07